jgi:hypothetical protein
MLRVGEEMFISIGVAVALEVSAGAPSAGLVGEKTFTPTPDRFCF